MAMNSLPKRIQSKFTPLNNGCWYWTGATNNHGYGYVGHNGKVQSAHRVVYELIKGPIPVNAVLDHTCHNDSDCTDGDDCIHRRCVNPDHLEPVTQKVNNRRGKRHATPKTHCPSGHEFTPENTRLYLNPNGRTARICRTCNRLRLRALRAK